MLHKFFYVAFNLSILRCISCMKGAIQIKFSIIIVVGEKNVIHIPVLLLTTSEME